MEGRTCHLQTGRHYARKGSRRSVAGPATTHHPDARGHERTPLEREFEIAARRTWPRSERLGHPRRVTRGFHLRLTPPEIRYTRGALDPIMCVSGVRLEGGEVMKLPISASIVLLALAIPSAAPAAPAAPDIAWKLGPTLPTPLARFDGEIAGNRIYFLGGRTTNDATIGNITYLDVPTHPSGTRASLCPSRSRITASQSSTTQADDPTFRRPHDARWRHHGRAGLLSPDQHKRSSTPIPGPEPPARPPASACRPWAWRSWTTRRTSSEAHPSWPTVAGRQLVADLVSIPAGDRVGARAEPEPGSWLHQPGRAGQQDPAIGGDTNVGALEPRPSLRAGRRPTA